MLEGGCPIRLLSRWSMSSSLLPGSNGTPVYISAMMQPRAKMSTLLSYWPGVRMISGALYHRVLT